MKRMLALLAVLVTSIVLDQVTKEIAIDQLKGEPSWSALGGSVRLVYAENPGAFLGLGRDWPDAVRMAIFIGLAAVAVVVGAVMVWRSREKISPLVQVGAALFVGGAVGNLIDRIFRDGGRVVDFMQLGIGSQPLTGVFNVADVFLMGAIPIFLFAGRKKDDDEAADEPAEGAASGD
jgi:signal peptidase II